VDLNSRTLRVVRAYSEEAPRGELSPVKNHQARTVPVPEIVSREFADYKALQPQSELVFPSASGTPLRNRNWRRDVFDSAVEALGLEITPHNLRDTAASLAIQEGASVVAVARLLGHESAATTLNQTEIQQFGLQLPNGRHLQNIYDFLGQPVQLPMPLGPGGTASMTYRAEDIRRLLREQGISGENVRPYVSTGHGRVEGHAIHLGERVANLH